MTERFKKEKEKKNFTNRFANIGWDLCFNLSIVSMELLKTIPYRFEVNLYNKFLEMNAYFIQVYKNTFNLIILKSKTYLLDTLLNNGVCWLILCQLDIQTRVILKKGTLFEKTLT